MSDDENEVQAQSGDVYHDYDNSVHHAVNLWPLAVVALCAAVTIVSVWLGPEYQKQSQKKIPWGKSYTAVGNLILCAPFQGVETTHGFNEKPEDIPYRALIRTPKDNVFEVAFRAGSTPPPFASAIGEIRYHECGVQGGRVVHCFDSFQFTHEGIKPLDGNGKPIEK